MKRRDCPHRHVLPIAGKRTIRLRCLECGLTHVCLYRPWTALAFARAELDRRIQGVGKRAP